MAWFLIRTKNSFFCVFILFGDLTEYYINLLTYPNVIFHVLRLKTTAITRSDYVPRLPIHHRQWHNTGWRARFTDISTVLYTRRPGDPKHITQNDWQSFIIVESWLFNFVAHCTCCGFRFFFTKPHLVAWGIFWDYKLHS